MRSRLYDLTALSLPGGLVSLPALREYQLAGVNKTLQTVHSRSRFYAGRADIPPAIERLEQLADLPFTTENDLKRGLEDFLCISPGAVARIVTLPTSGSTGPSKRIGFSDGDIEAIITFFRYGMQEMAGPGMRVMIGLPGTAEYGVPHLLATALQTFGVTPLPYGAITDFDAAARFVCQQQPNCIVAHPVQLLGLAAHMAQLPTPTPAWPQTVLLTGDTVSPHLLARVERGLHCKAFNHYGSTEMGYGGAVDCGCHQGLHLRENDLFFEVVHPDTGRPVPPGQAGELVFTTLTRTAMPLVRYRTGDMTCLQPATCSCTSPLPRISPPWRRAGGRLRVGGFELTLPLLDDCVFALDGITDCQLWIKPDDTLILEIWTTGAGQDLAGLPLRLQQTELLQKLAAHRPLEVVTAPPGAPPPCTQGKRLFRAFRA
ncbi:MAG: phenylacetate--CoA ligase family protein [Ruminococcaceae bacterium]|nr:phenylacetate--CoA ligase family protein [Oscillospiraceae bacterium]